jgi:hypothetical protein
MVAEKQTPGGALMFAPYCPTHGSRVLLFDDNIERIVRTSKGLQIAYRCNCGYQGLWFPGDSGVAAA